MHRLLFWNLQKKSLETIVGQAASLKNLDLILTCEDVLKEEDVLAALLPAGKFECIPGRMNSHMKLYTKIPSKYMHLAQEVERFQFWRFRLPAIDDFMIISFHSPLKREGTENPHAVVLAIDYRQQIDAILKREACENVVIVGDFNMNPFDSGMLSPSGFHAMVDERVVRNVDRWVFGRKRRMFYNPMWGLLGDINGAPGTHFYSKNALDSLQWHMLDQILLSPKMICRVPKHKIEIVDKLGATKLATPLGRPKKKYSDHFPIYFEIEAGHDG